MGCFRVETQASMMGRNGFVSVVPEMGMGMHRLLTAHVFGVAPLDHVVNRGEVLLMLFLFSRPHPRTHEHVHAVP